MKIAKLKIRQLYGITEYENNGESVELTGENGAGKTSVIDSIRFALTNKSNRKYIVHKGETEGVPNPVKLAPYRTFLEVLQPESDFIFRISEDRDGAPIFKLVGADGGLWKYEAVNSIKSYLQSELEDVEDITIIG